MKFGYSEEQVSSICRMSRHIFYCIRNIVNYTSMIPWLNRKKSTNDNEVIIILNVKLKLP